VGREVIVKHGPVVQNKKGPDRRDRAEEIFEWVQWGVTVSISKEIEIGSGRSGYPIVLAAPSAKYVQLLLGANSSSKP
jgi:hypothetical protein